MEQNSSHLHQVETAWRKNKFFKYINITKECVPLKGHKKTFSGTQEQP
jgi:hypothetical protein